MWLWYPRRWWNCTVTFLTRELKHQPEVFLQNDSHCACQDVLKLRSRTSKCEFSGWTQSFRNSGFYEDYPSYKSRNSSSEIMFPSKERNKTSRKSLKDISTELFCRRSWWFHVGLLNDLPLARKLRPRSSSARPAMPFVNSRTSAA